MGSKIDTEGALLCQVTKLSLIDAGFTVNDKCSTGATNVVRKALEQGEIDLYPEYTGSAIYILNEAGAGIDEAVSRDAQQAYDTVKRLDAENGIVWLDRAPANNTWAVAVPQGLAEENGLETMADFGRWVSGGGKVKLAASQEFVDRPDALKAFEATYGFSLTPDQLVIVPGGNTTQTETAAAQGTSGVNAAMAYGTDGAISALGLKALTDPEGAVAVYQPALTVRECVRERTLLDGVKRAAGRERFLGLAEAVGLEAEPGTLVGRLPAVQYTLLTAVLACLRPSRLVAYDDIDSSLTDPQLDHVYGALEVLREHGHPFAVSALASSAAPHGAVVLPLSPALEN